MSISRRNFLKFGGAALAAIPVARRLGALLGTSAYAADADLPQIKPDDATAKALGFCPDAKKPGAQCAARKAADKKEQFCRGCQLYTKVKGDGDKELGKCVVLVAGLVPSGGWCNSWVKKPS